MNQTRLILFSGLPGVGKSTIASKVAKKIKTTLFEKDSLESALIRSGIKDCFDGKEPLSFASYELLLSLADNQLNQQLSCIIDCVASQNKVRNLFKLVSIKRNATFSQICCICSDEAIHKKRLENRKRNIYGIPDGNWEGIEDLKDRFERFNDKHLIIDTLISEEENVNKILDYLNTEKENFR